MSQAKVDRYKSEKANSKKTMRKEKFKNTLITVCGTVVSIAVIGWVGYSAYGYFRDLSCPHGVFSARIRLDSQPQTQTHISRMH